MHLDEITKRMDVLYKQGDYEILNLVETIEIETLYFKYLTLQSLFKYFVTHNLRFHLVARKNKCALIVTLKGDSL